MTYAKLEKCAFHQERMEFLGYIISPAGLQMDPRKVQTVLDWSPPPKDVKGVQQFIGFANFYRHFIQGFSHVVAPICALVRKDATFQWTQAAQEVFEFLKEAFTSAPILAHLDSQLPFILEVDASDQAIGAVDVRI
ncbi:uncharacterized protein LOC128406114 [Podarcis raffonei]|uniref:uncharacterized protein LOC128406114 n=1 Tax=Podarcis raffonei TaxID=65483 RepID=UPI00232994D9|nr:uncharacterized protein LOC128406114 [Podarcis raffonei]